MLVGNSPPGCGKTTLAHVISKRTGCKFLVLSGASSNMADMKAAIDKAKGEKKMFRRHTIVFVDEIHRFKKNQQVHLVCECWTPRPRMCSYASLNSRVLAFLPLWLHRISSSLLWRMGRSR